MERCVACSAGWPSCARHSKQQRWDFSAVTNRVPWTYCENRLQRVCPVVLRASGDVTVMLLALSKQAWFKPEAFQSALLQIGKFICKIRTEESTHPSASLEKHMNSVLLKILTTAVFLVHSVAKR